MTAIDPAAARGEPGSGSSATLALWLMFAAYTFNYVDRQILIILGEPIRSEFGLNDKQLGFLTGTAFALFYATLGVPIARVADRWNRVNILAGALALWSAMTALCAAAGSFAQLALARVGVGVGEAGGTPPAVSLLSDYFDERRRGTAMAIYQMGSTVGILIGFVVGGWVNQIWGWRVAMLSVGLPGILLAIAIKLAVREPLRTASRSNDTAPAFGAALRVLRGIRTLRWTNFAATCNGIAVYGVMGWVPIYLIREYGMTTGQVGTYIGLIAGFVGSIGVFLGGWLSDFASRRDPRWRARIPAISSAVFVPLVLLVVTAPSATATIALLVPAYLAALAYTGPVWAILQSVSPPALRATSASILLLLVNLIGLALGPQLIGFISDAMQGAGDNTGLRVGICVSASFGLLGGAGLWMASNSLEADARAQRDGSG